MNKNLELFPIKDDDMFTIVLKILRIICIVLAIAFFGWAGLY